MDFPWETIFLMVNIEKFLHHFYISPFWIKSNWMCVCVCVCVGKSLMVWMVRRGEVSLVCILTARVMYKKTLCYMVCNNVYHVRCTQGLCVFHWIKTFSSFYIIHSHIYIIYININLNLPLFQQATYKSNQNSKPKRCTHNIPINIYFL